MDGTYQAGANEEEMMKKKYKKMRRERMLFT